MARSFLDHCFRLRKGMGGILKEGDRNERGKGRQKGKGSRGEGRRKEKGIWEERRTYVKE